jgi:O-antigen ligase
MILTPSAERRWLTGWLAALLVWTPLPFGSVTPWALLVVRLAAFAAVLPVVWDTRLRDAWAPVRVPALAIAGLALLGIVQAAPWPPALVARLSPVHAELTARLPAEALQGVGVWSRLTLAPGATLSTALTFAALAALVVAAAATGRSARSRGWLLAALAVATVGQLFYGLRAWLAGSPAIWGRATEWQGRLRGTFVNADHAALYFEIAMAAFFAWGWWAARRAGAEPRLERRLLLVSPPLVLWAAAFGGIVLSGSRAGLAAALVGTTAQALLLALAGRRRLRWLALATLPALAAVGLALLTAGERGFARLLGTSVHEVVGGPRQQVWGLAMDLWRRFPGTGCGLGTWDNAMPLVQPAELLGVRWGRAHNDYLELLATGGLVGAALMAVAMASLVRRLLLVQRSGRSTAERAAALAALGALAAVGLHELFDFGLSVPANLVACAVLVAAAAAGPTAPEAGAVPLPAAGSGPAAAPRRERGLRRRAPGAE